MPWRRKTPYAQERDWVFASIRKRGKQPLWPEAVLRNHLRPAAGKAGITKHISWHTFCHTFNTLLAQNGEDVKTVQSMMRHANLRLILEVYTHAVEAKERQAQSRSL